MRFSIITIALNAEKYIEETLSSVQAQSFTDYEHLVWDGGSQDRTAAIVAQFPHVIYLQGIDEGISDAMNKAAQWARGEYLIFLHADDFLAHRRVLEQLHFCLTQHPSVRWLYGRVDSIDEGGYKREGNFTRYRKGVLYKYNMISHPGVVLSRKLFEEMGGYRTDLHYAMDYELWLRLSKKMDPFVFDAPLAFFRSHGGSTSTSRPLAVAEEAYRIRNEHAPSLYYKFLSYRTWHRRKNFIKKMHKKIFGKNPLFS